MKRIAKAFAEAVCILSVMVIAGSAAMFITGAKPAVVKSGSMEPTIKTGSLIIIGDDVSKLKEKEIVAFERGGEIVVHRLIRRTDEGWVTKGDANETEDPWRISEERIVGKAVLWIPGIGYIIGRGV